MPSQKKRAVYSSTPCGGGAGGEGRQGVSVVWRVEV